MRTVEFNQYGGPEVLRQVGDAPAPSPGPREVSIRVHAASVNPVDCAIRRGYGKHFFRPMSQVTDQPFPLRMGRDAAGVVSAVGKQVRSFQPGDRVYVAPQRAAIAEFIVADAALVAPMPAQLDFVQAASLPFVAMTAWNCLVNQVGLTRDTARGKRVLVARGAGGVGSFAIQLLKAWGATVVSTASTRNVAFVQALGADRVIDHTRESVADLPPDFDAVLDSTFTESENLLKILKVGGDASYITITSPRVRLEDEFGPEEGARRSAEMFKTLSDKQAALGRRYLWGFMKPDGEALRQVSTMVDAGSIRPQVDRIYPLADIASAHEYCESGQARGKIVLSLE